MSSARRWSDINPSPAVDAAMRRAAAGVCGFIENECEFCDPAKSGRTIGKVAWLRRWNRDHLARVFVAALNAWKREGGALSEERFDKALIWQRLWFLALTDPRAALAQLLDLLNIEPPEGLNDE